MTPRSAVRATASVASWHGEAAVLLESGPTRTVWLPEVGMLGVSFEHDGFEHVAVPGGVRAVRAGHTAGLPLLAPWANRLGARHYRAAGRRVDLSGVALRTDEAGRPIHGLLVGRPGWVLDALGSRDDRAQLVATFDASVPPVADAFPFPHTLTVTVQLRPGELAIRTRVDAVGRRRVPVSFGWHPYLRVPGPRRTWELSLPAHDRLELADGIPTGRSTPEPAGTRPIGRSTADDLLRLRRGRRFALTGARTRLEVEIGGGFGFAQIWVPAGRDFAAIEPMVARTDALTHDDAPIVAPGGSYSARWVLRAVAC